MVVMLCLVSPEFAEAIQSMDELDLFKLDFATAYFLYLIPTVKRLHDCDHSGWLYLFALMPLANVVLALYLLFKPGTPWENKYGPA
jgi:uncharacterized membrane protein YhaH (DUF805 family)